MNKKYLSKKLKMLRIECFNSIDDFAILIAESKKTVLQFESGNIEIPRSYLVEIISCINLDVELFLHGKMDDFKNHLWKFQNKDESSNLYSGR